MPERTLPGLNGGFFFAHVLYGVVCAEFHTKRVPATEVAFHRMTRLGTDGYPPDGHAIIQNRNRCKAPSPRSVRLLPGFLDMAPIGQASAHRGLAHCRHTTGMFMTCFLNPTGKIME